MSTEARIREAYLSALDSMSRRGPGDLHRRAGLDLEEGGLSETLAGDSPLRLLLLASDADDLLRREFHKNIGMWDHAPLEAEWVAGTEANSAQRRSIIVGLLKVDADLGAVIDDLFPVVGDGTVVIAEEFEPWYSWEVRNSRDFYWKHYSDYLVSSGKMSPDTIVKLDSATSKVVERLTDPAQFEARQAKGLVVGYVQSGKTANFTGVIAKAIDAGYRLVIVLTGTTDLLRGQTQRRIDMELVGRENILRGVDLADPDALADADYQTDQAWLAGKFLEHGAPPSEVGYPDIHRLTTSSSDYRSLQQGIAALDFERRDRTRPFFDPANLYVGDARLVVVKKNAKILGKLVKDLKKITARLTDIPAIIIDDESDQASLNTSNPKKWVAGKTERTAINRLLSEMLSALPRAQYVGYTATPFANVFVDPSDALDIFPKDFLISLDRPAGYMGAEDFHDFDTARTEDQEPAGPLLNKDAHVRLREDGSDSDLLEAIDSFVLSGAVKLYREQYSNLLFSHHTMLVHEAMQRAVHREAVERIQRLWRRAGYFSPASRSRLKSMFERELLPGMERAKEKVPFPSSYDDLEPFVGVAAMKIGHNGSPALSVNSDKEIEQEDVDFDKKPVWRILVGGNKLARGFTVEGLTVAYYWRKTGQADTLMQMGRWFGFRAGYRDLVRLYTTEALYDAFESICMDERFFRDELRQYAVMVDGRPLVTPAQIPPLVASHLLKPTAASKMYNAVLTVRRSLSKEPSSGYPAVGERSKLQSNIEAMLPVLDAASVVVDESNPAEKGAAWDAVNYRARCGVSSHSEVVDVLGNLTWANFESFRPDLQWLRSLTISDVERWVVVMPQPKAGTRATFLGRGPFGLHGRTCSDDGRIRGNSEPRHRNPLAVAARTPASKTAYLLVYPVYDRKLKLAPTMDDPSGVVLAISLQLPGSAVPSTAGLLTFVTRDRSRPAYSVLESSA